MIYERKWWVSTVSVIMFLALFYIINMSWEAINYSDWLSFEVLGGGNYYQNWTWQIVLSITFLLYWSVNYNIPIQHIVRFGINGQLGHELIKRTNLLAGLYGLIYWIIPYFRIHFFHPTNSQLNNFSIVWFLQVLISMLWLLLIINLTLIIFSYYQHIILTIGLMVLIGSVVLLHIWPFSQSLFADTQVTAMIKNRQYSSGISRAIITGILMSVVLYFLQKWFLKSMRRWEWLN